MSKTPEQRSQVKPTSVGQQGLHRPMTRERLKSLAGMAFCATVIVLLRCVLRLPLRLPGHSAVFVIPLLVAGGAVSAHRLGMGLTGSLAGLGAFGLAGLGLVKYRPAAAISLIVTGWVLQAFGLLGRRRVEDGTEAESDGPQAVSALLFLRCLLAGFTANALLVVLHVVGFGPFRPSAWFSPGLSCVTYGFFGLAGGVLAFAVMVVRSSDDQTPP